MSEAKHTPGPWRVALGNSGAILAPSPSGTPDRYVQVIYHDGDNYIYQSPGDARLIAAAPELLEALERVEKILDRSDVWAMGETHKFVLATIAKATAHSTD